MLLAVALVAMLVLTPAVVLAFVGRLEVMQFAPLVTSCSASAGVDPSSAAGGVLLVLLVGMPVLQHTSRQSLLKAKWERRVFGSGAGWALYEARRVWLFVDTAVAGTSAHPIVCLCHPYACVSQVGSYMPCMLRCA